MPRWTSAPYHILVICLSYSAFRATVLWSLWASEAEHVTQRHIRSSLQKYSNSCACSKHFWSSRESPAPRGTKVWSFWVVYCACSDEPGTGKPHRWETSSLLSEASLGRNHRELSSCRPSSLCFWGSSEKLHCAADQPELNLEHGQETLALDSCSAFSMLWAHLL